MDENLSVDDGTLHSETPCRIGKGSLAANWYSRIRFFVYDREKIELA